VIEGDTELSEGKSLELVIRFRRRSRACDRERTVSSTGNLVYREFRRSLGNEPEGKVELRMRRRGGRDPTLDGHGKVTKWS